MVATQVDTFFQELDLDKKLIILKLIKNCFVRQKVPN